METALSLPVRSSLPRRLEPWSSWTAVLDSDRRSTPPPSVHLLGTPLPDLPGGVGGEASHLISTNLLRCHFGPERRHDRRTWTGRRVRSIDLAWSVSDGRMTKTSAENSMCRSPDLFTITSHHLVSTHPSVFPFQLPELLLTQEHHQRYVSVLFTLKKKNEKVFHLKFKGITVHLKV